jgi:uncharacterized protein (DUF58 family)
VAIESLSPETLRQLELLTIRARRRFHGLGDGGHVSLRKGHGIEFADYRSYELGDDPRHIDWGVYARSERLYVKQFREDQNLTAYLFLDSSASMRNPDVQKWSYATQAAQGLSYVLSMQQDRVAMMVPGVLTTPVIQGPKTVHRISKCLMDVDWAATQSEDFVLQFERECGRVTFPGIAVVISDFLFGLDKVQVMFDRLRAKNLDITALQILGGFDVNPLVAEESFQAVDAETGEQLDLCIDANEQDRYQELFQSHQRGLQEYFGASGISFTSSSPADGIVSLFLNQLTQVGLVR